MIWFLDSIENKQNSLIQQYDATIHSSMNLHYRRSYIMEDSCIEIFLISFQTLVFIIWLSFVFVKHFKMWPLRTHVWLLFTLTIAKSLR